MRNNDAFFLIRVWAFGLVWLLFASLAMARGELVGDTQSWADEGREFEEHVWKEKKLPLPPYPNDDDLLEIPAYSANKAFTISIDRKNLSVTEDGVVHYTVVAVSRSGSRNVLFEGIRCDDGQYKVYGYGSNQGKVIANEHSEWKPVDGSRRQDYRIMFHEQYMCGLYGQMVAPGKIIYRLEHDETSETDGARILGGDSVGW